MRESTQANRGEGLLGVFRGGDEAADLGFAVPDFQDSDAGRYWQCFATEHGRGQNPSYHSFSCAGDALRVKTENTTHQPFTGIVPRSTFQLFPVLVGDWVCPAHCRTALRPESQAETRELPEKLACVQTITKTIPTRNAPLA